MRTRFLEEGCCTIAANNVSLSLSQLASKHLVEGLCIKKKKKTQNSVELQNTGSEMMLIPGDPKFHSCKVEFDGA